MLEILLCSVLTILPDYLFRRFGQGKRFGKEITLYSVWFELRWGIVSCLMLSVGLITVIFYYHPSTKTATLYYRDRSHRLGGQRTCRRDLRQQHQRRGQEGRTHLPPGQRDPGGGGRGGSA